MKVSDLKDTKELHHAYLVVGSAAGGVLEVETLLKKRGVETAGNPDFYVTNVSELGAEEARAVAQFASLKPLGDKKYVLISFSRATTEAQNALLKVIEDAPGASIFFLCVDSAGHVLPTIRSRCIVVTARYTPEKEDTAEAEEFVRMNYADRLSKVEKMTGYISKTQDRVPVRTFVRSLMTLFHGSTVPHGALRDLLDADRYLRMQGSSAKAVLGHLAVTLPRKTK